jgi:nuclease S1
MKRISLTVVIALILKTSSSFAWGARGHNMVAEVAMNYLNTGVKDSVEKYLGEMSTKDASTWMDDVRSDHQYDYMKTWHYADVEKDKTYVRTEEENAVFEIEKSIGELSKRPKLSKEQIKMDLKLLFHLIGDLHQPLHCGYASDKGGNSIKMDFDGKPTNLHSIWDSKIIELKLSDVQKGVIDLVKQLTPAEIKKYEKIDVLEWYNQSRGHLDIVYNYPSAGIDEAYITKSLPVIEKQIVVAGLRLASVLNEAFKK